MGEPISLSLVERVSHEGTIKIHSVVHEWLYLRVPIDEAAKWIDTIVTVLAH